MPDLMEQLIADLVKGAARNTRENGGPGVNIIVARENRGREEKLANMGGLGALAGSTLGLGGGGAGAMIGAGLGADPGRGLDAALDAGIGHSLGGMAGGGLGALLHLGPEGAHIAKQIGATGGSMIGGQMGGKDDRGMLDRLRGKHSMFGGAAGLTSPKAVGSQMVSGMKPPAAAPAAAKPPPLPAAALAKMHASSPFAAPPKMGAQYEAGAKAACVAFGIKVAIFPALLAAGRAALPAAKAVGNFATKNPIGQQMAGTAASMGVQKMMTPQQPG